MESSIGFMSMDLVAYAVSPNHRVKTDRPLSVRLRADR